MAGGGQPEGEKESSPTAPRKHHKNAHVGFFDGERDGKSTESGASAPSARREESALASATSSPAMDEILPVSQTASGAVGLEKSDSLLQVPSPVADGNHAVSAPPLNLSLPDDIEALRREAVSPARSDSLEPGTAAPLSAAMHYTNRLREKPRITYLQTLSPWNGRIHRDHWLKVAARPFILFAYPAVLWSAMVYSLSVGWLIVLSESVAYIYQRRETYNFTPLQTGLIYISPFVGGILGTGVAGKVSDIIVRYMTRRNGGIYEPEFRLVMSLPIAVCTTAGLMAFGWSAEIHDSWVVPTVFFGLISFGCCLGSTTSITFVVDSYRQYAGEALVTLNFSKSEHLFFWPRFALSPLTSAFSTDIFDGMIFSLFLVDWLEKDGSRTVFLALGGIQLGCLLFSIPMYIYGKRARMWTVRKRMMEKF